ncbi:MULTISPECIES: hypothetical protein [unclassified Rhizobium]|jgi:hypothetical protein|uniref:hypothetical protein n=1 Tax=unclassified Rhizobium TaxID=2613769 RepID=UPI00068FD868|nr:MULTISPECIES: hypothetical protein [unclassified Rhizobium]OJY61663.1 MAG: hypothetical protein BGP09_04985 [Rhizobium sp. 60-20]RKD50403.1 hypothetical protein BJ928_12273 [Rhizobium sp. WW_1]
MHIGNVCWCFPLTGHDLHLLPFKIIHACLHRRLIHAVLDRRHDPGNGTLDLLKRLLVGCRLRSPVVVQPVHFLGIGTHGFGDCLGGNKAILEAGKNTRFDLVTGDRMAILAGAAPVVIEAGIAVRDYDPELAAAASAGEKAAQKSGGTVR